jgi:hypothetical protein
MSNRNSKSTRRSSTRNARPVYNVTEKGVYRRERKLSRIGMGIRRGDTRHGDYSNVVLWKPTDSDGPSRRFVMSLAEARAFKAFLDRELSTLAR